MTTQILEIQPKTLYTHCYRHSLHLACKDTIRNIKPLRDALDTTHDLSKLLKCSSTKSDEYFGLQQEIAPCQPGFHNLFPTRWTIRASSLQSKNYEVLEHNLERFAEMSAREPEMSARCAGIGAQMSSFSFLFGVSLGCRLLSLADNLSTCIQSKRMSAAEAQKLARLTIKSLEELRSDARFQSFWSDLEEKQQECDIELPAPPRRRKRPARYGTGDASPHFSDNEENNFRVIYFEAVDTMTGCIKQCFDQPGYKQYSMLEFCC